MSEKEKKDIMKVSNRAQSIPKATGSTLGMLHNRRWTLWHVWRRQRGLRG